MRHARFPALVAAVALVAAACSGSGAVPEPTASTTTETPSPTPTPTTSEVDLSAPPPNEVTEEYVQAVLEAIYEVEAETIRIEVEAAANGATTPPKESLDLFSTIYGGEQLTLALQGVGDAWKTGELNIDFSTDPEPSEVEVLDVVDVGPGCIVTTFLLDDSPTLDHEVEPTELMALLEPKPEDVDPQRVNAAPWVITEQVLVNSDVEGACEG